MYDRGCTEYAVELAAERTARVLVVLKHQTHQLHQVLQHTGQWHLCYEPECLKTRRVMVALGHHDANLAATDRVSRTHIA